MFLSDLHNHSNEPILKAIAKVDADAILVGGDFIHNNSLCERGFEFLAATAEILPTFCSLGNHEMWYVDGLRERIFETGAVTVR